MALNKEDIVGQDIFGQGEFCDHSAGVFCSCICGFPDSAMLDQIFRSFVLIRDNFIGNSVIIFVCHGKHVNTWRDWDWDCLKAKARVFIQAWITTSYVQCLCIYDSWPFKAREKPPNLFYLPPRKRLCLNTMNRQCSGTNIHLSNHFYQYYYYQYYYFLVIISINNVLPVLLRKLKILENNFF